MRDPIRAARRIRAAAWTVIGAVWGATVSVGLFTGEWPAVWWLAIQGVLTCLTQVAAFEYAAVLESGPPPPEGVAVTYPDGRVLSLGCVYDGRTADGSAVWLAVVPEAVPDPMAVRLSADVLPAKTVVRVEFRVEVTPHEP